MPKYLKLIIALGVLVVVGFFVLRWLAERASPMPDNLGVENGRLAPCPDSPNCVATNATDDLHAIEPYTFAGDAAAARDKLLAIIDADANATLISSTDTYIHAEYRSSLWRFIDDVEFVIDEATNTIQFRSASRLGYGDMGANRSRMEAIRTQFNN